jgi:putative addiction module component (TIGR02574 family)
LNGVCIRLYIEEDMATNADKLVSEIRALPDEEKLRVLDAILTDLDKPDDEIDHIWAVEARKRWNAYKAGRLSTVSYEELMSKYNR